MSKNGYSETHSVAQLDGFDNYPWVKDRQFLVSYQRRKESPDFDGAGIPVLPNHATLVARSSSHARAPRA